MNKKICVITGACGLLGSKMAIDFAEKGYHVIGLDHVYNDRLPSEIEFMELDLRNPTQIESVFSEIKNKYGAIHVLINNGAIAHFIKHITEVSLTEIDDIINTNIRGAFLCSAEFVKANKGQSYGRIINIASTRWHQNMENWEAYGLSKGAMVSFTNSLCVSLKGTPITVNAISPGWISGQNPNELSEIDHTQHPSNRVGIPSDISHSALFLCDEKSEFINGNNLIVDGGMTKFMYYAE